MANNEIDFQEGFDVEEVSAGKVKIRLDLTEVQDQIDQAGHPDLAVHDALGLATDDELVTHAATPHGGTHPDLAAHDALGLAMDSELSAHAVDTTAIHGIVDTATLETSADAQAKIDTHAGLADPHTGYQRESEKGAVSGYASLDPGGKVPSSQIPSIAFGQVFPVSSEAEMLALSASAGDIAIRDDVSETFILATTPASEIGNWHELLSPAGGVTSVNTRTGAVTGVQDTSEKGAVSGYASLDGTGKVPDAQLPVPLTQHPDLATHDAMGLATDTELATHESASNPHPGYLTPTEGSAAYDVLGAATSAQTTAEGYADTQIGTHAGLADPHTGYQKESEKAMPSGYASLDTAGQVPGSQLSDISVDGGVVGFYGVTPVARAVMATGTGKTVDNIITALQSLGLFIQTGGSGGSGSLFDTGVFDTATFGAS